MGLEREKKATESTEHANCSNNEEKKIYEEDAYTFEKLTPTSEADISVYESALDYAFDEKNKDIHNVAVTGVYGSGKSSIVYTYAKHRKKHFLYISLGTFSAEQQDKDENVLEKKIINQLIQQIKEEYIPYSVFHIKKDCDGKKVVLPSALLALTVITAITLLNYSTIAKIFCYAFAIKAAFFVLLGISFILLAIIFGEGFLWVRKNRRIEKVTVKGNEIVFNPDDDKSYFSRNLDEVLYVLEHITNPSVGKKPVDAIVFEDIDRFKGDVEIRLFEQLRELCVLANERVEQTRGDSRNPIRFIYLLSDDTFQSKERTKFFDFILPVIPVIGTFNSYVKFHDGLKTCGLLEKVDDVFLRKLSVYFDDYRLLKNVINEFQIYSRILSNINQKYEELLAIIVYKNFFPKDFVKLQSQDGYVFYIFAKRVFLEEDIRSKLDENSKEDGFDIANLSFSELIERSNEDVFTLLEKGTMNEEEWRHLKSIHDDKRAEVIRFLILNGYIDDRSYLDYMFYFDENSMSITDKNYLKALFASVEELKDYKLQNADLVFRYLEKSDFMRKGARNYDLINYILLAKAEESVQVFVKQLKKNKDFEFVKEYISKSSVVDEFLCRLCDGWKTFFQELIFASQEEEDFVQSIVMKALLACPMKTMVEQNESCELRDYISEQTKELDCPEDKNKKLLSVWEKLGVSIKDIGTQIKGTTLREGVIVSNLYEITYCNLSFILENQLDYSKSDYEQQMLSLLLNDDGKPWYSYLMEHMDEVLEIVSDVSVVFHDEADIVIKVVKAASDSVIITSYLNKSETVIQDLRDIYGEYWPILSRKRTYAPTTENVYAYFNDFGLSDELVEYLDFAVKVNEELFDEDNTLKNIFWQSIQNNSEISDEAYRVIARKMGTVYPEFSVSNMRECKCRILLEEGLIPMSRTGINTIRAYYPALMPSYIATDVTKFNSFTGAQTLKASEIVGVLEYEEVTDDEKITLLQRVREVVSVKDLQLSDRVFSYILLNNLNLDDLPSLIVNYNMYSTDKQNSILLCAQQNYNILISNVTKVPIELLTRFFEAKNVPLTTKATVLDAILKCREDKQTVESLLRAAGQKELAKLFADRNVHLSVLPNNSGVEKMLGVLKDNGVIRGYKSEGDGLRVIRYPKKKTKH